MKKNENNEEIEIKILSNTKNRIIVNETVYNSLAKGETIFIPRGSIYSIFNESMEEDLIFRMK